MKNYARSMFSTRSIVLVVLLFAALAGCSHDDSTEPTATGSAEMAISLPAGASITTVSYKISGNGITPITGSVGLAGTTVSGIPVGTSYLVEFTAMSTDGTVSCAGQSHFDITANALTQVSVVMH